MTAAHQEEIDTEYRNAFGDPPAIVMMMKGWAKGHEAMSEDEAWQLCRQAISDGKPIEILSVPLHIDV